MQTQSRAGERPSHPPWQASEFFEFIRPSHNEGFAKAAGLSLCSE